MKSHLVNDQLTASDDSNNLDQDPFDEPLAQIEESVFDVKPTTNKIDRSETELIDFYQDRLVDAKVRDQLQITRKGGVMT